MAEVIKRLVLLYHGAKEGRAAWFDLAHRAALTKAAAEPDYALVEAEQALLDELDPNMAQGHLTNEGKPDKLPVMLRTNFERLLGLAERAKPPGAGEAATKGGALAAASPWTDIVVGSIVLASDSKEDGWFECVVAGVEGDGQTLHLRWRDFPEYPHFTKPISRVGLLPRSGLR